jgi:hypothetical protein
MTPKETKLHLAFAAAGLTPSGYVDTLRNIDGQVTGEIAARIQQAIVPLLNMALTDARGFLRLSVASTKATKESKPDPIIKVRASEAGQILGAVKLVKGFDYKGMGWQAAVNKARKALGDARLKADGGWVLTPEEKLANDVKQAGSKQLAELMISDLPDEAKLQKLAEIKASAAAQVQVDEATDQARRIIKGRGIEYATHLVAALEKGIANAEAEHLAGDESDTPEVVTQPEGKKSKAA